jgi:hypothetical protein
MAEEVADVDDPGQREVHGQGLQPEEFVEAKQPGQTVAVAEEDGGLLATH